MLSEIRQSETNIELNHLYVESKTKTATTTKNQTQKQRSDLLPETEDRGEERHWRKVVKR